MTVYRNELLWRDGERAGLEIECSSGTYVRQLVAALGDAYCLELRRVAIGAFHVEDADPERVMPLQGALDFLPEAPLSGDEAGRVAHGVAIERDETPAAEVIRLTADGRLIALGRVEGALLKPFVVFRP